MCVSLEMVKRAASPPDAGQTLTAAGDRLVHPQTTSVFRGNTGPGAVSNTAVNEGVFSIRKSFIYICSLRENKHIEITLLREVRKRVR